MKEYSLSYKIEPMKKLEMSLFRNMDLYEILKDERDFMITVQGRLFFHEPLFPMLELVKYCIYWVNLPDCNFEYNTIESDENPMLSFCKVGIGWKIASVWQKFDCDIVFSYDEVATFISGLIDAVLAV